MLKGLALLRLGRHDDCVSLIEEVHDQHPMDEQTLQAMTICYKELNDCKHNNNVSGGTLINFV